MRRSGLTTAGSGRWKASERKPARLGVGIGEGKGGDQHGGGTQREGVVAGQVRLRRAGRERADGARHAGLMLAPQGFGRRTAGRHGFVLNADGLMAQAVSGLQHAVGGLGGGAGDPCERQEGGDESKREGGKGAGMQPEGRQAEQAEPGGGDEKKEDGDRQQQLRRHGFGQQHGARRNTLAGQQAGERRGLFGRGRRGSRHPSVPRRSGPAPPSSGDACPSLHRG